jgi:hypothetical protein
MHNLNLCTEGSKGLGRSQTGHLNLITGVRLGADLNGSVEGQRHNLLDKMKIIAQSSLQSPANKAKGFPHAVSRPKSSVPMASHCRSRKNNQSVTRYSATRPNFGQASHCFEIP